MSRTLLLTSVLAAASIALAAEVTLPEGCTLPANDGNFSTWKTKFPVCVRADCKHQTAKKNSKQLSDVTAEVPTPKVTEGGLIFEQMLVRSFFFRFSFLTSLMICPFSSTALAASNRCVDVFFAIDKNIQTSNT